MMEVLMVITFYVSGTGGVVPPIVVTEDECQQVWEYYEDKEQNTTLTYDVDCIQINLKEEERHEEQL